MNRYMRKIPGFSIPHLCLLWEKTNTPSMAFPFSLRRFPIRLSVVYIPDCIFCHLSPDPFFFVLLLFPRLNNGDSSPFLFRVLL